MMKKKNDEDEGGVYYEIWIWKDQITFLSSTKNNCISFWIIFLDLFFETIHICTLLKNDFFFALVNKSVCVFLSNQFIQACVFRCIISVSK